MNSVLSIPFPKKQNLVVSLITFPSIFTECRAFSLYGHIITHLFHFSYTLFVKIFLIFFVYIDINAKKKIFCPK